MNWSVVPSENRLANWSVAPSENRPANWSVAPSENRPANWSAAPPRENRLMNWSVTEFNEKSRPRITKPAAVPIGRPVSELERYGIKEIENGGLLYGRSLLGRVRP